MAVQEQTPLQEYTANGIAKQFDLEFDCESADHLIVSIDDLEVPHTDWYLSGNAIMFHIAPANGKQVKIQRNTPFNRTVDYQSYNNSFRPQSVNGDFDRLWLKLQELGVADWLMKLYVDRLHQQQEVKINDLKNYVDDRDDELRAYLIEEIRKQGVALDQLDDYYNYLMQRLAQIAVDKGWDASFVVDESGLNQQKLNSGVESIADLLAIPNPKNGSRVYVKSYYKNTNLSARKPFVGGGVRVYVDALKNRNDGGVCINGWVLSDTSNLNVYHFGAYGDWNATAQTGHDDTTAFQNYANYLMTYEDNFRKGGSRIMRVLAGNYRLDGFTITQGSAYFSFNLIGDGQMTQLWFNPTGQGIILEQENTVFQDIYINGKLSATYPSAQDPAIPSIVTAKLANKILDVDFIAKNVNVGWFNTFATISGRGFTFINGGAGMGATLFKLNLTNDLIAYGSEPTIHAVATSLRHYNVSNCRFDVVDRIFDVVGDADSPLKNYINGVIIANNELTLVAQMGRSTLAGARLVSPSFINNVCIGCFGGQTVHNYGAIKDGLDSGNSYYNFIDGAVAEADGINKLYRAETIDGLTIVGTKAKDIKDILVHGTTSINNIKINDCTFENIFDAPTGMRSLVYSPNNPTNVHICGNTLKSVGTVVKRYVSTEFGSLQNSTSIVVKDNEASTGFVDQSQNPTLSVVVNGVAVPNGDYTTRKCNFTIDGSYIRMTFSLGIQNITATSGNIRILLPVPAIADNPTLSSYYSGGGFAGQAAGLVGTNNIQPQVSANTDQCIKLMSGNSEFNLSAKTSNSLAFAGVVTYRFK